MMDGRYAIILFFFFNLIYKETYKQCYKVTLPVLDGEYKKKVETLILMSLKYWIKVILLIWNIFVFLYYTSHLS